MRKKRDGQRGGPIAFYYVAKRRCRYTDRSIKGGRRERKKRKRGTGKKKFEGKEPNATGPLHGCVWGKRVQRKDPLGNFSQHVTEGLQEKLRKPGKISETEKYLGLIKGRARVRYRIALRQSGFSPRPYGG